jgi:hypothetical protein
MATGQRSEQTAQSVQPSWSRFTRASPNREKGLSTAASGQNQRQNGMAMNTETTTIAAEMAYAHHVMSVPCRLINA